MFTIAALQLKPKFKDVLFNIKRVSSLLSNVFQQKRFDLVVLPELALTGYNFKSSAEIKPYLESIKDFGRSISFGIETSKNYKCFTVIGYPEIFDNKIYNSSCLIAPNGLIVFNYRKSFLYETDEVWGANENPKGFTSFRLNLDKDFYYDLNKNNLENENYAKYSKEMIEELGLEKNEKDSEFVTSLEKKYQKSFINSTMGICMDLNPYKFEAPFEKFEFSNFCFKNDIDLVLFPMAWLSSISPSITYKETEMPEEKNKDMKFLQDQFSEESDNFVININNHIVLVEADIKQISTFKKEIVDTGNINYWIMRSIPLFNSFYKINHKLAMNAKDRFVVFCNRVGIEDDVLYGGSSSIINFNGLDPLKMYQDYRIEGIYDAEKFNQELNKFQHVNSQNPSVQILGELPIGQEGIVLNDIDFKLG